MLKVNTRWIFESFILGTLTKTMPEMTMSKRTNPKRWCEQKAGKLGTISLKHTGTGPQADFVLLSSFGLDCVSLFPFPQPTSFILWLKVGTVVNIKKSYLNWKWFNFSNGINSMTLHYWRFCLDHVIQHCVVGLLLTCL